MAGALAKLQIILGLDASEVESGAGKAGKAMDGFGAGFSKTGAVVGAAVGIIGSQALKMGDDYAKGTNTLIRETGASGDALKELQGVMTGVAGKVPQDMNTVGEAVGRMNTRLGLTGPALEDATKKVLDFSRVTGIDATVAVDLTADAMSRMGIETDKLPDLLDKVTKAGQLTGVSSEALLTQIGQFGPVFRDMGYDLDETIGMMAQFHRMGGSVEDLSKGMNKAFLHFAKEGAKDGREAMEMLVDRVRSAETPMEGAAIAAEIFGTKLGGKFAAAIRDGTFDIEEMTAAIAESGGTLDDVAERTLTFKDKIDMAMNNIAGAVGPVVGQFGELGMGLTGMTKIVPVVTGLVGGLTGGLWAKVAALAAAQGGWLMLLGPIALVVIATAAIGKAIEGNIDAFHRGREAGREWGDEMLAMSSGANESGEKIDGVAVGVDRMAESIRTNGIFALGDLAGQLWGTVDAVEAETKAQQWAADQAHLTALANNDLTQSFRDRERSIAEGEPVWARQKSILVGAGIDYADYGQRVADVTARQKSILLAAGADYADYGQRVTDVTGMVRDMVAAVPSYMEGVSGRMKTAAEQYSGNFHDPIVSALDTVASRASGAFQSVVDSIINMSNPAKTAAAAYNQALEDPIKVDERIAEVRAEIARVAPDLKSQSPNVRAAAISYTAALEDEMYALQNNVADMSLRTGRSLPDALQSHRGATSMQAQWYVWKMEDSYGDIEGSSKSSSNSAAAAWPDAFNRHRPATAGAAASTANAVKAPLIDLSKNSYSWGAAVMDQYRRGILSQAGAIRAAVLSTTQGFSTYLKTKSPPGPQSPMHGIRSWGFKTMLEYAKGIGDASRLVSSAVLNSVALPATMIQQPFSSAMAAGALSGASGSVVNNRGPVTININGGDLAEVRRVVAEVINTDAGRVTRLVPD